MRISFCCPPEGYRDYVFDAAALESGVGGSESALINLARALARRGHEVQVFGPAATTRTYEDVAYRPYREAADAGCDVAVLFRFSGHRFQDVPCRLRVLWSHDLPTADPPYGLVRSLRAVDGVFAVSDFHAGQLADFAQAHGIRDLRLAVGGNGVDTALYPPPEHARVPGRFLYCSVPDRGLDGLLRMWPAIQDRVPGASLVVTGGYELWGHRPDPAATPAAPAGVCIRGVVSRRELVAEQRRAAVHLHPCPLPENFCLASMECQAAGTPTIASSLGALPATVVDGRTGIVVGGTPGTPEFEAAFVAASVGLVGCPDRLRALSEGARRHALAFDYDRVAAAWAAQLAGWLSRC
jgi:glycosyltransferase involved in cell wall biosynthesis